MFAFKSIIPASIRLALFLPYAMAGPPSATFFESGFEAPDFSPGDLSSQGDWQILSGSPVVQAATTNSGSQALGAATASFELPISTATPVVWIDGWYLDPGTTGLPMIPSDPSSAILFFSSTHGLLALDGDGAGNGNFVEVSPTLPAGEFIRITLRLDFSSTRYDVWVNGIQRQTNLGFKDSSVTSLNSFQRDVDGQSYLDDLSITTWGLDNDTDGDGLLDLDELNLYGTDPSSPDSDHDGANDFFETIAGTDPNDPTSFFALNVDQQAGGPFAVSFQAVAGRLYTLQRNPDLDPDNWSNVPGYIGMSGSSGELLTLQPADSDPAMFYRLFIDLP